MIDPEEELRRWQDFLLVGRSNGYVHRLTSELLKYLAWLTESSLDPSVVSPDDIETYLIARRSRRMLTVTAIRLFHKDLLIRGLVTVNAAKFLKHQPIAMPRSPCQGVDVRRWLDRAADNIFAPTRHASVVLLRARVWAMAELHYASGISTLDLINLKPTALEAGLPALMVGDRIVPTTKHAASVVALWRMLVTTFYDQPATYLFPAPARPELQTNQVRVSMDFARVGRELGYLLRPSDIRLAFMHDMTALGLHVHDLAYITGTSGRHTIKSITAR